MSPRVYNISIAGCGKVAHLHASAIQGISNARLSAVWSRSPQSAEVFARKYNTKFHSDITAMVKENNIDLTIICTPHPFHKKPAIEAALAGANVLVEKPLAANLNDCDEIIEACRRGGVKLGVISQRRWYEPVKRVKEAIESGKIGILRFRYLERYLGGRGRWSAC